MLEVLFEDNHILVVLKPQNVASQPDPSGDEDMLTIVKAYLKKSGNKPGEAFAGLVHRLDRPTGGVMVFAKTSKAATRLSEQLREGIMQKTYLAVVEGEPKNARGHLVNYLQKDARNNKVNVVPQTVEGAKRAELEYATISVVGDYSLLSVNLMTGRSHQIRVQLKNIGHALCGDRKYGAKPSPSRNLSLWAYALTFEHPITKLQHTFKVLPPKEDFPWKFFTNASVFN